MRDQDHGSAAHQVPHRAEDFRLGFGVDGARGLVEDEHRTVLQEGAGQRDALPLASGELRAALTDLGVVAARQAHDELVGVGGVRGGDDLLPCGTRGGVRDVLRDAGRKQDRFLQHDGKLAAQVGELVVAQIHAVEPNAAGCGVVEAREQADQRGLAGARRPDHAEAGSRLDRERDVAQDRSVRPIGERDALEGHGARGAHDGPGMRSLRHLGLLVQQRECPLGAGEVALQPRRLAAHGLQGLVQLSEVPQHQQQLPEGEHAGPDVAHADEQHGGHAQGRDQPDEQAVAALQEGQPDPGRHAFLGAVHEPTGLPRLLAERLDHAQRPERLLHDGERRALELLHLARLAPHARAIGAREEEERRRDGERHQRERAVQPGGDDPHRDQGDGRRHERNRPVDQDVLERGGVVLDAVDGVGGAARVMIGERQPLHLLDELGAEVEHEPLPDVGPHQRRREALELAQRGDAEQ